VRDTTAWTIGRIFEFAASSDPEAYINNSNLVSSGAARCGAAVGRLRQRPASLCSALRARPAVAMQQL
jgi:hypothetical protein